MLESEVQLRDHQLISCEPKSKNVTPTGLGDSSSLMKSGERSFTQKQPQNFSAVETDGLMIDSDISVATQEVIMRDQSQMNRDTMTRSLDMS